MTDSERIEGTERRLYIITIVILAGIAAAGIILDGPANALIGLWEIQIHPARLINDFTFAASEGAALLNASLVAFVGLVLVRRNGIKLSGPTIAAVFTMFGFGLFGKTPLNITPILLGVFIAAKIARGRYREYILIALFGTALAPFVSLIATELGFSAAVGIPIALACGLAAGVILPAVARAMLRFHQGYNLYNVGLTTGMIALFAAALVFGGMEQLAGGSIWNETPSLVLVLVTPVVSVVLLVAGILMGRADAVRSFLRILKLPGRLPSDFMSMESVSGALVNMGILGLATWGYAMGVGAPINGPVIGGLFTIIGFAAFGKHPANVWPVMAGVVIAALTFGHDLAEPGVILAALFGTTLAPFVGDFGFGIGLIAGFLHLTVVMRSGGWHAGIGLYNNGFAGGLTATVLVAIIELYRANVPTGRRRRVDSSGKEEP